MNLIGAAALLWGIGLGLSPAEEKDAVQPSAPAERSPLYGQIQPLRPGQRLYVFQKGPRTPDSQFIAVQTLQGVSARRAGSCIWIDMGDPAFSDYLASNYQIEFDRTYAEDFSGLIRAVQSGTSGRYVLYDLQDKPSLSAATTAAGLLDAAAADKELAEVFEKAGYTMALDVRGRDCRWVYENFWPQLNHEAIIVHTPYKRQHPSAPFLRDWGPALRALDWWYPDEGYCRRVYRNLVPCSPVYGWQSPVSSDEGVAIRQHSEEGLFQIPSDWMVNLSVHASLGPVLKEHRFVQKALRRQPAKEEGVHYVTFILSDMDNILTEIGTRSFFSQRKFYQNPHRGQFPMGWGMAPSLVELSPGGVDMWYQAAGETDGFVGYCGLGYFYPSHFPAMQEHADRLDTYLKRADLRTLLLIDRLEPEKKLTEEYAQVIRSFAELASIRGFFYLEYKAYALHSGRILRVGDKPLVTARFDFRSDAFYENVRSSPQQLAASINALPKDPSLPQGYTFVTVHAWSKGLDDIYETIQQLDPKVRVVGPEEFIELIRLNLPPAD
ncbi:MAG TPA: GxGYxYP family putative glycoside hydrolase [Anaerohalosphaeraceae bacterium]|nr:GxGYxYP family putative glycoside hydrolase [Anaerohalosphaeraceae bacterium]HPB93299.1 GxGYxYP family putative glycoside hydrolase [Anaerohalosphaeraceae bacterium]HRT24228.1 GxGYxYP family putative glycoside hydrolase [Anaerohalosphaeraceae bacterium]